MSGPTQEFHVSERDSYGFFFLFFCFGIKKLRPSILGQPFCQDASFTWAHMLAAAGPCTSIEFSPYLCELLLSFIRAKH